MTKYGKTDKKMRTEKSMSTETGFHPWKYISVDFVNTIL